MTANRKRKPRDPRSGIGIDQRTGKRRKTKKKCPSCQSTKTKDGPDFFKCEKCGYLNKKKIKKIEKFT